MTKRRSIILATALAATFAASGATAAPPDGGTISIEPKTADGEYDPAMPSFISAASEALATKGFTILEDPGHAAYVAELILSRAEVGTGAAKASGGGPAVMPGNAPGVGAGVTIPLSTGKSRLVPIERTRLEIRIRKRGQDGIVWDGAAITVRENGTRRGAIEMIATDLSEASLRSYPTEAQDDVGVP